MTITRGEFIRATSFIAGGLILPAVSAPPVFADEVETKNLPDPWGIRYHEVPIDGVNIPASGRKLVALTFDDGPDDSGVTQNIARNLWLMDTHATFFLVGGRVKNNPRDAGLVAQYGHEIASHGWEHRPDIGRPVAESYKQVEKARRVIKRFTGRMPLWYRSPQGKFDLQAHNAIFRTGHLYANWSCGTLDTVRGVSEDQIVDHTVNEVRRVGSGCIIVAHSTVPEHYRAMPRVISILKNEGYEFVTLSYLAGSGYPIPGISR